MRQSEIKKKKIIPVSSSSLKNSLAITTQAQREAE